MGLSELINSCSFKVVLDVTWVDHNPDDTMVVAPIRVILSNTHINPSPRAIRSSANPQRNRGLSLVWNEIRHEAVLTSTKTSCRSNQYRILDVAAVLSGSDSSRHQ